MKKKFSGWSVFFCCCMLSFFVYGGIVCPFSLFMNPVITEYGIKTSTYSLVQTAGTVITALAVFVWAPKLQQKNAKTFVLVSLVLTTISFVVMGASAYISPEKGFWIYAIAYFLVQFGAAGCTTMPISSTLTSWFITKRSSLIGIAFALGAVGNAVFTQVITRVMAATSWRVSMMLVGGVALVFSGVCAILFFKKEPEMYGQEPYYVEGAEPEETEETIDPSAWQGVDRKTAMKSPAFYLLFFAVVFVGTFVGTMTYHGANFMTVAGLGSLVGNVFSIFALVSACGSAVGGFLLDKLGEIGACLIATVLGLIALVCLMLSPKIPMLSYVFVICLGIAIFECMMIPSCYTSTIFGVKDYANIYAPMNAALMVGNAIGQAMQGFFGNGGVQGYITGYAVAMVPCVLSFVCVVFAIRTGKKLQQELPVA